MATKLDKKLTRESSSKVDDREILVTLTDDQTISMKLKGMKSGIVSVGIEDLFKQLSGVSVPTIETPSVPSIPTKVKTNNSVMISLHDIRHRLNISGFEYPVQAKLDEILNELINEKQK